MSPEQADRIKLGWSREKLARHSGVSVASVYLIERIGGSIETEDARVREALQRGLAEQDAELARPESDKP